MSVQLPCAVSVNFPIPLQFDHNVVLLLLRSMTIMWFTHTWSRKAKGEKDLPFENNSKMFSNISIAYIA